MWCLGVITCPPLNYKLRLFVVVSAAPATAPDLNAADRAAVACHDAVVTHHRHHQAVLKEVSDSNGKIVLFIDEIHTVVGAGATGGAMDAGEHLSSFVFDSAAAQANTQATAASPFTISLACRHSPASLSLCACTKVHSPPPL